MNTKDSPNVAALYDVYKRFGKTLALNGITLEVRPRELTALLGPNGAGKTTVVSIMLGLRKPDQGRAELFGKDPHTTAARVAVGATPQELSFPGNLRVEEIVDFVRGHFDDPCDASTLLATFGLDQLRRRQAGGLSLGEKRRLALAVAFAGNPQAVFLDEPTTGLDVGTRRAVWNAVQKYVDDGGTVLLTTHNLEEAEALANRVVVINHAKIIADGSVDDIKSRAGVKKVKFRSDNLQRLPDGASDTLGEDGRHVVFTTDADYLVTWLVKQGIGFSDLEISGASLEEAFLHITEDAK